MESVLSLINRNMSNEQYDQLETLIKQRQFIDFQMSIDKIWSEEIMKEWESKLDAVNQEIFKLQSLK